MPTMGRSFTAALRPSPNPVAVAGALRALTAAGVVLLLGVWRGDLQAIGVAFLGAACAVAFATAGVYRARLVALLAQGVGGAVGIAAGATVPASPVGLVVLAACAGLVSGLVGATGPNGPAFGTMLSIGVAYGEFGGSTLAWCEQSLWYLIGTLVVAGAALSPWLFRRGAPERLAAAGVFFAAADLCAVVGTEGARTARVRLAAASAAARDAGRFPAAELTAFAAAALYAEGRPTPRPIVDAVREAGTQVLAGQPINVSMVAPAGDAGLQALADALSPAPSRPPAPPRRRMTATVRSAMTRPAFLNGARIALCLAVATAVAVELHRGAHGFWVPLTVAVIVRPEYASVFVRTVNRLAGTVVGAAIAALVLWVIPPGLGAAAAAALALSAAVLTAPKLYAWYVMGITTSTLLASSIGVAVPILPAVRLLDTVIGAVVAVVCGYLLWPGARRLPGQARLDRAVGAARTYLEEAAQPPGLRAHFQSRRDDAYRLAHQVRSVGEAAMAEPPPVSSLAVRLIPVAVRLEDVVDDITEVATSVDAGVDAAPRVRELNDELDALLSRGH
jgi:hypothetical protein